jgi:hypothetical protein
MATKMSRRARPTDTAAAAAPAAATSVCIYSKVKVQGYVCVYAYVLARLRVWACVFPLARVLLHSSQEVKPLSQGSL